MSNVTIAGGTTNLPVANSIDGSNDYLPIYTASATATQAINRNTLLGLASAPVGLTDSQTLTNKILTSPTISGPTLSGTITGTYTIGGTPTFPSSVVTLTGSQTLTNKILTSPTISAPTITNATLTADSISGFTTSNTGTIYGVAITTGQITGAGSIASGALATNAVAASNLATNAITLGYAQITTNFATSNTTDTQVTGLSVTVTIPSGGRKVKITVFAANVFNTTANTTITATLWNGTVGSGTQLSQMQTIPASAIGPVLMIMAVHTPSAGSITYNVGIRTANGADAANISAASTTPAFILVEAI